MMTSKTEMLSLSSSKKTTVLMLSPTLSTQKMLLTFCSSHQQNFPSPKCPFLPFALLSSHLLYSSPLSIWASWIPSPSAPKSPSSAWEPHPSLLLLNLQGQLTPSVFSLLHHQESIWIRGGLQGTQTKAQNGPTTLPKTDLELTGLSHVGFGPQNY